MKVVKNKIHKKKIYVTIILALIILVVFLICEKKDSNVDPIIAEKEPVSLNMVKSKFHEYVKIQDGSHLYQQIDNSYQKCATIHGQIELNLDPTYQIVDEYFKLSDSNYFVKYNEVSKIDTITPKNGEYKNFKNYIPYNENIVLNDKAKLYVDDTNYYEVNEGNYAILIKDTNKYGIIFNNTLTYVSSEDVKEVITSPNTESKHTEGVSVLNYHYVVSSTNENGELEECQQSICITDTMFDSHIKYLKDNGFYGASMRDLELFIDGKIQLPEKSVVLTFDDGWYVARTIGILEKYQMLGTLFLIGSLASPNDYVSAYLEVHSHGFNLHDPSACPSSVGRGGILCLSDETILEDLRKSRESLNNTTYFCYPFYNYNDRAIQLLQQAGFTMAFAGELRDSTVRVGQNKFKIPRYVIVNYTTMEKFIRYVS